MNNESNLVSIITPAYNASRFILETIKSVKDQTYANWEMLIIDDCSTDDTRRIVEEQSRLDQRIHLIAAPQNGGPAKARNLGLQKAKGRYIAFLDSDDLWLPEKLERQLKFMKTRQVSFSFTQYRYMNEKGVISEEIVKVPDCLDYKGLLRNTNLIGCLTVLLDREKIGPVEFKNIPPEDFVLWLDILKKGHKAYGLQEDLSSYRVVRNSVSRNKLKASSWVWKVYRDLERLNMADAAICFIKYAWLALIRNRKYMSMGKLPINKEAAMRVSQG